MLRKTHVRPGIYMVINNITNDFYIGGTRNIYYRIKNHEWTLKNGRHGNSKMRNDASRHGYESFSYKVLEFCDLPALEIREQYFIGQLKPTYNKWNCTKIPQGYKHSPESIDKMTKNNRGVKDKESFRKKLREAWKIRRERPDGIATLNMLNRTGKKVSDETKFKISEASKNHWKSDEYREKVLRHLLKKGE